MAEIRACQGRGRAYNIGMLSDRTLQELREELTSLHQQSETIKRRMEAIRSILDDGDAHPERDHNIFNDNSTMAGTIRGALRGIGTTTTAKEVTRVLEKKGVKSKASTPLSVTVGAVLHRMATRNTGGVRRVGRGKYRID